jgi:DNA-binding Lrp family transcriptional regulator
MDKSSVFYYTQYRPDYDHYPLPDYSGALAAIETDVEISNYHLNNIKNGFTAGTMINFFNGIPVDDDEYGSEIVKQIKTAVTGSRNAGEVFVNVAVDKEHAAEIIPMQPNNLDKQFEQLAKDVTQNIFIGHKVTNPQMMGVMISGQLGGREQITEAYEMFKETYIIHRQKSILYGLDTVLTDFNLISEPLEIVELKPISEVLPISEATIVSLIDRTALSDYIYKKYGIEKPENSPQITPSTALSAANYFEKKAKTYDNYQLVEEHPVNEANNLPVFKFNSLMDFKFDQNLSPEDERILKVLSENPDLSPKEIGTILDMSEKEIRSLIDKYTKDGLYGTKGITPKGKEVVSKIKDRTKLVIVYKYEVRADAPPLLSESREFCQRLERLSKAGKRWTKEDIENISNDMEVNFLNNTNPWLYRGGWYRAPGDNVAKPFCRHTWVQQVMIEN